VLANVLVAQGARVLSAEGERLPPTGPSFRDLTRVAGANTAMWRDIYLANADALVRAIDDAIARLASVRELLATGDGEGVAAWNDAAREDRRRLLESDLAGGEVHELRVQVPNRPGIVAEIALALGRASIDIVDMALYPAPGTHGTIALWLRSAELDEARGLVAALGLEAAQA
jgi:prephenate dehydrogenase